MPENRYVVYARDPGRNRKGTLPYITLDARVAYCAVGGVVLKLNPRAPKVDLLAPGWGLIVDDEETGDRFASGPIRSISETLPEPSGKEAPREELTITAVTDEWHLGTRLVYPTPSVPAWQQTAAAYDNRTGIAETVCRALVNLNAGPGAIAARRVAGLTLEGADGGRGTSVKTAARFDNLLELLTSTALAGGIGFRVLQVGTDLQYQTYIPLDRSAFVRFPAARGTLRSNTFALGGPAATREIVAGDGTGTARSVVERGNAAAETDWGARVEKFVDRSGTTDATTLNQAGDEALLVDGPTAALTLSPIDSPRARYGHDNGLGTKVTRNVRGQLGADVVREVRLTVDADGARVVPLIGGDATTSQATPRLYRDVRKLADRVGAIEKRR